MIPLVTLLILSAGTCGFKLWDISSVYFNQSQVESELAAYRPDIQRPAGFYSEPGASGTPPAPGNLPEIAETPGILGETPAGYPQSEELRYENPQIAELQDEINGDVVGWLTIPGTKIDYPFVITDNDSFYLTEDVYKHSSAAGTLFMDCRCARDFSGRNTIIYGHNMKNESMFGDLKLFSDEGFFDTHTYGIIYMKDSTYTLEFFAYLAVRADDTVIYDTSAEKDMFLEYAQSNAIIYRNPEPGTKIVTLSTCASGGLDDKRVVLLGVLHANN